MSGAYTTSRTIGSTAIVAYRAHVQRLSRTLQQITFSAPDTPGDEPASVRDALHRFRDPDRLQDLLLDAIRPAMTRYFGGEEKGDGKNARVAILVTYLAKEESPMIAVHMSPLLEMPASCKVFVCGTPRESPEAKDSQWVRDRKSLLEQKPPDANEVLLMDAVTGNIYEGASSNFFAVVKSEDGSVAVHSSPQGTVLLGTIMCMVLQVCDEQAIRVVHQFPNLKDLQEGRWAAAFITSTSRLVLPVDKAVVQTGSGCSEFEIGSHPVVDTIQHHVLQMVQEHKVSHITPLRKVAFGDASLIYLHGLEDRRQSHLHEDR